MMTSSTDFGPERRLRQSSCGNHQRLFLRNVYARPGWLEKSSWLDLNRASSARRASSTEVELVQSRASSIRSSQPEKSSWLDRVELRLDPPAMVKRCPLHPQHPARCVTRQVASRPTTRSSSFRTVHTRQGTVKKSAKQRNLVILSLVNLPSPPRNLHTVTNNIKVQVVQQQQEQATTSLINNTTLP